MQHLKYHDRVAIEYEISENPDSTLRSVADKLGVSRSTVMREIIRNSTVTKAYSPVSLPGTPKQAPECPKLRKWPYCCNRCAKTRCHLTKLHYRAGEAERTSKATNAKAARKPSKETLKRAAEVEEKVAPMIKSGVSIEAAVKAAECDVHPTTIRRWIDRDIVSPSRVDLPRAAKFRPKALYDYSKANYRRALLSGARVAVQGDTVIGTAHDSHCILTVMLVRPKVRLQFGFRVRKTKEAVAAKVLWLWERMDAFGCAFGLLLTDNGPGCSPTTAPSSTGCRRSRTTRRGSIGSARTSATPTTAARRPNASPTTASADTGKEKENRSTKFLTRKSSTYSPRLTATRGSPSDGFRRSRPSGRRSRTRRASSRPWATRRSPSPN